MKIAVTGASGQLGQLVIAQLKEKTSASQLIGLARSPEKINHLGIEVRQADYEKPETLPTALEGVDTLLLISGSEVGKRISQHQNVIQAAKSTGIKWIVYTSILRADTSTISLASEHLATEQLLKDSGISHTILRNGWYNENYVGSVAGALVSGAVLGSAGDGKISAAARKDYAEAAATVLTGKGHEGKIYELAGDTAFTLAELAGEIEKQSGKAVAYTDLSQDEYAKTLEGMGLPQGLAKAIAGWDVSTSKGDLYDEGHILSQLIGRPTTPISETVTALLNAGS